MAETTITLNGRTGMIALGGVIALVMFRLISFSSTSDPALNEVIQAELQSAHLRSITGQLEAADHDAEQLSEIAAEAGAAVRIYSTKISKPLLSFSNNEKTIVKVEYELPGKPRQLEYWRFKHSIGNWQYRGRSNVVSYYLNFM